MQEEERLAEGRRKRPEAKAKADAETRIPVSLAKVGEEGEQHAKGEAGETDANQGEKPTNTENTTMTDVIERPGWRGSNWTR